MSALPYRFTLCLRRFHDTVHPVPDPLSPTIFNVVVDAVVRHWVNGIMEAAKAKGETVREGRHQSALFYTNDGMVVLSDPAWPQGAFTALVAIFDRVGLMTENADKKEEAGRAHERGRRTGCNFLGL